MRTAFVLTIPGLLLSGGAALAQPYPSMANDRTTALYVQGGVGIGSSETRGAIGGAFTHDFTDRLGLEVSGAYLDRGAGVAAWHAAASLLVHLRVVSEDIVPYLAAGAGLYRTSFDLGHSRLSEGVWRGGHGPMWGRGGFMGMPYTPYGPDGGRHGSFTDPVFPVGGGLKWTATERLSLRADGRALVVAANGETFTVGLFTVGIGVRF